MPLLRRVELNISLFFIKWACFVIEILLELPLSHFIDDDYFKDTAETLSESMVKSNRVFYSILLPLTSVIKMLDLPCCKFNPEKVNKIDKKKLCGPPTPQITLSILVKYPKDLQQQQHPSHT